MRGLESVYECIRGRMGDFGKGGGGGGGGGIVVTKKYLKMINNNNNNDNLVKKGGCVSIHPQSCPSLSVMTAMRCFPDSVRWLIRRFRIFGLINTAEQKKRKEDESESTRPLCLIFAIIRVSGKEKRRQRRRGVGGGVWGRG